MLKLLVTVGLVATLASSRRVWGPGYRGRGMTTGKSEISLEVPPADQRDPEKCELFETENYLDYGCKQSCSVNGYFGNLRIQDAHPRSVSQCKSSGTYCRIPIITHEQMNVTYSNGRCSTNCRCVPATQTDSYLADQLTAAVGALITGKHHHKRQHRVHSGRNHFGSVKLHIPPIEARNQTTCEDYESSYFAYQVLSEYQCKRVCTLNGNLGGLQFEGKPRVLNDHQSDGTYCELASHGEGKITVKGVEQVQSGQCKKGVCRPYGWVDPSETTTASAPSTVRPSIADATIRNEFVKRVDEVSNEITIGGRIDV